MKSSIPNGVKIIKIPTEQGGGYAATIPSLGENVYVGDGETVDQAIESLFSIQNFMKDKNNITLDDVIKIENVVFRHMIGMHNQGFAGFNGIVTKLLTMGSVITSSHAKNIDFGMLHSWMSVDVYKDGIDVIEIKFDRFDAIRSKEYYNQLNNLIQITKEKYEDYKKHESEMIENIRIMEYLSKVC